MLNPSFSRDLISFNPSAYILPLALVEKVVRENTAYDSGDELRLQDVYGVEQRKKLDSIGLKEYPWHGKRVLDACCGTGFLSYHLLKRSAPRSIVLADINHHEVDRAKELIGKTNRSSDVTFLVADVLQTGLPDGTFDMIIGNSFLHHFYDVPRAMREFLRLLKPGGMFVTLHEPTPAAVAVERGRFKFLLDNLLKGDGVVEEMRYTGKGISPHGGADVWIFKKKELISLVRSSGFGRVVARDWHIARQFIVARKQLHLNSSKRELSPDESALLGRSISLDSVLCRLLPSYLCGSVSLAAQKPE